MKSPHFDYSLAEWYSHTKQFLEAASDGATLEEMTSWFEKQYSDPAEALWKSRRLFYAILRMNEILRSYPEKFEDFCPSNEKGSLISKHLIHAFWRVYSDIPDEELESYVPAPWLVERLAEQDRRMQPPSQAAIDSN